MNRQSITVVLVAVLLVAVGLLWLRVIDLEKSLASLRQQISSHSIPVSLAQPPATNGPPPKQLFKLIDSAPSTTSEKSNVGVPWNVERAMVPIETARFRDSNEPGHLKAVPTPKPNAVPIKTNSK